MNKTLPVELVKQKGSHSQAMDTFVVHGRMIDGEMERMASLIDQIVNEMLEP